MTNFSQTGRFAAFFCLCLCLSAPLLAQPAQAGVLDFFFSGKKNEAAQEPKAVKKPQAPAAPQAAAPEAPAGLSSVPRNMVTQPAAPRVVQPASPAAKAEEKGAVKTSKLNTPQEVDAAAFNKMLESKNPPYIIDVREGFEFDEFHIAGAVNIPLGSIASAAASLPRDRDIVVYCRTDRRSEIAQKALKDFGVTNVANLKGGLFTWAAASRCDMKKKTC